MAKELTKQQKEWLKKHTNLNGPMSDEWWEGEENVQN